MENQSEQKLQKNNWYKNRIILKTERQLEEYKVNSWSWIFFNRLLGVILDLLGWVVLGIVLYLGWKSGRWLSVGCDRITPQLCDSCFRVAQNSLSGIIG